MHSRESIVVAGSKYDILDLTEFGFITDPKLELEDGAATNSGMLTIGDDQLAIEFRVRKVVDNKSTCSFYGLSINTTERIKTYLKKRHRQNEGGLEERTYDELASGFTGETGTAAAATAAAGNSDAGAPKLHVKSLAMLLMFLAALAMVVIALVFMRSRSTLSVANSALVGNCLRVNSRVEGEIIEVLAREGDEVKKGDVLIRISNPELSSQIEMIDAECETAKSKVAALKKQKEAFSNKLKFASKKLDMERKVVMSELQAAAKTVRSAQLAADRLRPFVASGSVTQLELAEVENLLLAEESNYIAKQSLMHQIDFAIDAAGNNVLILGDRVDDELGRIESELAIAEAELVELEQATKITTARAKELEILSPRDGTIYVNYRQKGEFIKVADELVGISYPGETWAAGQVSSGQASRVLPGQPVQISVPSLKTSIDGIVMAVGHRAMYSKGHYSADFRGATATDVPVKVYIEDLPEDIPSGIRLQMVIKTGYGIKWLDDAMGYKHLAVGKNAEQKNTAEPPKAVAPSKTPKLANEVLASVGMANEDLN